jgi:hypothetical protein
MGLAIVEFSRLVIGRPFGPMIFMAGSGAVVEALVIAPRLRDGRTALTHGIGVFLAAGRIRSWPARGVVSAGLLCSSLLRLPAAVMGGSPGILAGTGRAVDAHRQTPLTAGRR